MDRIVFTGGGSGGHVYPGLAVIEELRRRFSGEIVWIGSTRGIERRIVRSWNVPYIPIPTGKLRRELNARNVADVFNVAAGILRARRILRTLKPLVVFSKGGYVSVPVVIAARSLRIAVFTHESDRDPGLATRINARFATGIFVPYEETRRYFSAAIRPRVEISGNPVRSDIFHGDRARGRELLGLTDPLPVLLVLGGSQGAHQINEMIFERVPTLCRRAFVVHQTGEGERTRVPEHPNYRAFPFLSSEYADFLAAADLVISRSGAGTVWELAVTGKPAVLVPLRGSGTRGDQVKNADAYARCGAAVVLAEDATAADLEDVAADLLSDAERRAAMSRAAGGFGRTDAAAFIADAVARRAGIPGADTARISQGGVR